MPAAERVGRRRHRLERGEGPSGRHPHLRVRVGGVAPQLDGGRRRSRTPAGGPGRARRGRRTSAGRSAALRPLGDLDARRDAERVEGEVSRVAAAAAATRRRGDAGQPEVRVPAERDRHAPSPGRDDGRLDVELAVPGGDRDLDPVRERERRRVDVDRRAETGGAAAGVGAVDRASRARRRASRGSAGRWRRSRAGDPARSTATPRGTVAARRQPVRPRGEQRKAAGAARPQVVDATRAGRGAHDRGSAATRRSSRPPGGTWP